MNDAVAEGLLVVDKPAAMTSRAAVDRVLRWFPRGTRLGHTGTLDPLATGVLVLCLGNATRLTEYIQRMSKIYRTRLLLGARSDTDDADGTIVPVPDAKTPDEANVRACLAEFVGAIEQVPPAYSAAKVSGKRAYDLARRGQEVTLSPRTVRIYAFDVLDYAYPHLELQVHCGKGTYIRSLARDLGERLRCGALVETLRRTRVGPFAVEAALTLNADAAKARTQLLPMALAVAELPRVVLNDRELQRLRQGQSVSAAERPVEIDNDGETAIFDETGRLVAVATFEPQRKMLRPAKVLPS